eukprot:TRINITY_DN236_c0_g2_i2.p1 TRINITY_DN236_c0_g2~~TRINITY_DN236_c0_g2_i2.p1  ORF type:complete len:339 (+),score=-14.62 TRINITY_DN236_c0_g2_i2:4099-5115(+)
MHSNKRFVSYTDIPLRTPTGLVQVLCRKAVPLKPWESPNDREHYFYHTSEAGYGVSLRIRSRLYRMEQSLPRKYKRVSQWGILSWIRHRPRMVFSRTRLDFQNIFTQGKKQFLGMELTKKKKNKLSLNNFFYGEDEMFDGFVKFMLQNSFIFSPSLTKIDKNYMNNTKLNNNSFYYSSLLDRFRSRLLISPSDYNYKDLSLFSKYWSRSLLHKEKWKLFGASSFASGANLKQRKSTFFHLRDTFRHFFCAINLNRKFLRNFYRRTKVQQIKTLLKDLKFLTISRREFVSKHFPAKLKPYLLLMRTGFFTILSTYGTLAAKVNHKIVWERFKKMRKKVL